MKGQDVAIAEKLNVSRETFERLAIYVALLERWNPRINLVSRNSLKDIWVRHIQDSVQVFRTSKPVDHWVDLGSGGGFPGMVCAIMAIESAPETRFTLVESDQRKSAFLRNVARECGANCTVLARRIEAIDPLGADILSARALADLTTLLSFCDRHLDENGVALLPKGATWKKELLDARKEWNFDADPIKSLTEPQSVILKIKGVARG
ncbi:16S rRNA (guanine(527)-N(7))-methyltransferase RsmG [Ruegeria conchae]|uniref:Ribosomal RNA small subunit methyltransferase G n=1 Tax=Ruegeria conchae TaxID=981384 RepID=A0A497ZKL2_9RHOB|nr:16S rRNA (guanine(527)-N(7))-methyltransferase RsmG [Ruegeria conchae]RLK03657.1 16S rRNA (guanine527-N7)-methyltransferase [Ruegeria conchae]UWR02954.1 16S rRNA (guanine(527)-N(7))-methyltransferase RsmG [Ruegeria conchae]